MTTNQIAKMIREIRKSKGFSQVRMSKMLGISQGTLSKIENAEVEPRMRTWLTFAKNFQVDAMTPIRGRHQ